MERENNWAGETVKFLREYEWAYNFKMTLLFDHILQEKIPVDYLLAFRNCIREFDVDSVLDCPQLQQFFETAKILTTQGESFITTYNLPNLNLTKNRPKKWSQKKYAEVEYFYEFINNYIASSVDCFIDIGAGLGYLSTKISQEHPHIQTFAIEQQQNMTEKTHPNKNLTFVNLKLTDSNIKSELKRLKSNKTALIGLHSCGSLTPNTLRTFVQDEYNFLGIISCCYHKMDMKDFPMSQSYKENIGSDIGFISLYLFRLACQRKGKDFFKPSVKSEVSKVYHRALSEVVFGGLKGDVSCDQLSGYLESLGDDLMADKIREMNEEHERKLKTHNIILAVIKMQSSIQRLSELFVQLDRLNYLKENNVTAFIAQIIPENVSPRGEVIFAKSAS